VLQRKIEEAKGYYSTTQVVISISIAAADTFKYNIRMQQFIGTLKCLNSLHYQKTATFNPCLILDEQNSEKRKYSTRLCCALQFRIPMLKL